MKKIALLAVPVLVGCLGSAPKPPVTWTIDVESDAKVAFAAVCAPYGGQRFAVLRSDGSIAFDPRNSFAAAPGSIIKDAVVSLEIVSGNRASKGNAAEPTADGNYSKAFSSAFTKAYAEALEGLKAAK